MTAGTCNGCGTAISSGLKCDRCIGEWLAARKTSVSSTSTERRPTWPTAMSGAAYHGQVGRIVKLLAANSEGDPHAILTTLLVAIGNAVGRGPHWRVGGTEHHAALYALVVGKTSSGRKGTATDDALWPMRQAAPVWYADCRASGLSSGEGLVYRVRDAVEVDDETSDGGATDKRLLVVEPEFAQALKVMRREGNTLSPTVRALFDAGRAGALTKRDRTTTSSAHVSLIGQIGAEELRHQLDDVEVVNGFMNRFMVVCAKRSQALPFGGKLTNSDIEPHARLLGNAIDTAQGLGEIGFDRVAAGLWESRYADLTADRVGVYGAVCARAHAIVRRLAVVYALVDEDRVVKGPHLQAALEVWRYCEDSARYVFGDKLGHRDADRLRDELRGAGSSGLSRSDIRDMLGAARRRPTLRMLFTF